MLGRNQKASSGHSPQREAQFRVWKAGTGELYHGEVGDTAHQWPNIRVSGTGMPIEHTRRTPDILVHIICRTRRIWLVRWYTSYTRRVLAALQVGSYNPHVRPIKAQGYTGPTIPPSPNIVHVSIPECRKSTGISTWFMFGVEPNSRAILCAT